MDIATLAIVAHSVVESPETSRISERDDLYQDFSPAGTNDDQLFIDNLQSQGSGGGSNDNIFSDDLPGVSTNLDAPAPALALSDDNSKTFLTAGNEPACAATNPSKRGIIDDILSGESASQPTPLLFSSLNSQYHGY